MLRIFHYVEYTSNYLREIKQIAIQYSWAKVYTFHIIIQVNLIFKPVDVNYQTLVDIWI